MLMQVEGRSWAPSLSVGVRRLIGENGFWGLWRGNVLSVAKNIPESGLFW